MEIVVGLFLGLYIGSKFNELNEDLHKQNKKMWEAFVSFKENHQYIADKIEELRKEVKGGK